MGDPGPGSPQDSLCVVVQRADVPERWEDERRIRTGSSSRVPAMIGCLLDEYV